MNLVELERKLIAAARRNAPDDKIPYAFEKRIMAHIDARGAVDSWAQWGRALWRAAAPCAAIMLLLGVWSFLSPNGSGTTDLSQDFEKAMFAVIDQNGESW